MRISGGRLWAAAALLALVGCGQRVQVVEAALAGPGESCEARADCGDGLFCRDLICVAEVPQETSRDGGQAPAQPEDRSADGQRCGRRADCQAGLACIAQRCVVSMDALALLGPQKGGFGDSCLASNDCKQGLGCVELTCKTRTLSISATAAECYRVECQADTDCCANYQVDDPTFCAELDAGCAGGAATDCNLYRSLCTCRMRCDDQACVTQADCDSDLDCGGSGILRCHNGGCVQCVTDGECAGSGVCIDGSCRSGCEQAEQCGIFEACENDRCVHVGCLSDRQCQFATDDSQSRCSEGECRQSCTNDNTCKAPFHHCEAGYCTFVGCESDEECRAALTMDGTGLAVGLAVCRPPSSDGAP